MTFSTDYFHFEKNSISIMIYCYSISGYKTDVFWFSWRRLGASYSADDQFYSGQSECSWEYFQNEIKLNINSQPRWHAFLHSSSALACEKRPISQPFLIELSHLFLGNYFVTVT